MGFVVSYAPRLIVVAGIVLVALREACSSLMELLGLCREDTCGFIGSSAETLDSDIDNFQYPYLGMGSNSESKQANIRASLLPLVYEGVHGYHDVIMARCSDTVNRRSAVEDGASMDCSVCLCEFEHGQDLRIMPTCCHVFHRECIYRWLDQDQRTCPLCRASLTSAPGAIIGVA